MILTLTSRLRLIRLVGRILLARQTLLIFFRNETDWFLFQYMYVYISAAELSSRRCLSWDVRFLILSDTIILWYSDICSNTFWKAENTMSSGDAVSSKRGTFTHIRSSTECFVAAPTLRTPLLDPKVIVSILSNAYSYLCWDSPGLDSFLRGPPKKHPSLAKLNPVKPGNFLSRRLTWWTFRACQAS